jgi:LEA14-like dessication related protein
VSGRSLGRPVTAGGTLLVPWLFCACTLLPPGIEAPRVAVGSVQLAHATLLQQTYRVVLALQNPNNFDLSIEGLRYALVVNGQEFASGVSNRRLTVPRLGVAEIEVEAISDLPAIYRQIKGLAKGVDRLSYRLRGDVFLTDGRRVPFDKRGEIAAPLSAG